MDRLAVWREALRNEEAWLEFMVDAMREDDQLVSEYTIRAKKAYWDYEQFGHDNSLALAEGFVKVAKEVKASKFKLNDIRKQRERVQWYRRKVNQLATMQLDESSTAKINS